MALGCNWICN